MNNNYDDSWYPYDGLPPRETVREARLTVTPPMSSNYIRAKVRMPGLLCSDPDYVRASWEAYDPRSEVSHIATLVAMKAYEELSHSALHNATYGLTDQLRRTMCGIYSGQYPPNQFATLVDTLPRAEARYDYDRYYLLGWPMKEGSATAGAKHQIRLPDFPGVFVPYLPVLVETELEFAVIAAPYPSGRGGPVLPRLVFTPVDRATDTGRGTDLAVVALAILQVWEDIEAADTLRKLGEGPL
jgi:hypothetical protein